jgi:hypothetical protein
MAKDDESKEIPPISVCPGKTEVPTEAEIAILAEMKTIKERVRELKRRLNRLAASESDENTHEAAVLKQELARFKAEWAALDRKRQAAARERMIRLGHEEA